MLGIKLEQFEGPLDLLLHLIEEEELDITEVSLAAVADQYLNHLAQFSDEARIEELSDFIVIAAKLLLIKSRALVPVRAPEEEEEIEELQRQLKRYQTLVEAGKKIDALFRAGRVAFPRRVPLSHDIGFVPPKTVTGVLLANTFIKIVRALEVSKEKTRQIIFPVRISIREKIQHIIELLSQKRTFRFRDLIQSSAQKADVVVSFMALLELVKQHKACAIQQQLFSDIVISRPSDKQERISVPVAVNQRGQTLIEVIAALSVIAVGLVGVLTLATSNVRNQGIGMSRLFANNLSRDGVEIARNIRDTNWLSGKPWYEGLLGGQKCAVLDNATAGMLDFIECPSGANFSTEHFRLYRNSSEMNDGAKTITFDEYQQKGSRDTVDGEATAFYRIIKLDPICVTAEPAETLEGCSAADAIGVRVTSEVAWKQSGNDYLVRLRENLYNWR